MRFDVAVIGGGLSGLCAAHALAERGRSVVLLEKGDRFGGKLWTQQTPGGRKVEFAPTYIGPTQRHMQMLVRKFGLTTTGTFFPEGFKSVNHFDVKGLHGKITFKGTTHTDVPGIEAEITKIDKLSAEVASNLDEPWNTRAAELDAVTVQEWAQANLHSGFGPLMKSLLFTFVRSILSVGPDELSMLFLLYYCARCGGFRYMTTAIDFGPDSQRIREGNDTIARRLVAMLEQLNVAMRDQHEVERIEQDQDGVAIQCKGKDPITASYAIVAMPPPHTLKIAFAPELPESRYQLCRSMKMGRTFKGYVFYDRPWWREQVRDWTELGREALIAALGGVSQDELQHQPKELEAAHRHLKPGYTGYTNGDCGPFVWTMDATWNDDAGPTHPGIMWFATAKFAGEVAGLSPQERALAVHERLKWFFDGCDAPKQPDDFIDFDHHHGGEGFGPTGVLGPGMLTLFGEGLRKPHGRVHWAGTEAALFWGGYLEGAIDSGLRAAQTIDRLLPRAGGPVRTFWPEL